MSYAALPLGIEVFTATPWPVGVDAAKQRTVSRPQGSVGRYSGRSVHRL